MSLFFIGFFIFDTSFRTTHIDQDVRPTNLCFKSNTCTHAVIIFIFSLTELVSIIDITVNCGVNGSTTASPVNQWQED